MTVVDMGDDAVMFDAGVHLPALIELQEQEERQTIPSRKKLRNIGALPNDLILDKFGIRTS